MNLNEKVFNTLFILTGIMLLVSLLFMPTFNNAQSFANLSNKESSPEIYVYPNPASNKNPPILHLEVHPAKAIQGRIYDLTGRLINQFDITRANIVEPVKLTSPEEIRKDIYEIALNSKGLSSGVYLIAVAGELIGSDSFTRNIRFTVVN